MQYKIPIQIENEDTIILNLSLRQIGISLIGFLLAYALFKTYNGRIDTIPLALGCALIVGVFVVVAKFRYYEMTFLPFLLNLLRLKMNSQERVWKKGVDSYSILRTGIVRPAAGANNARRKDSISPQVQDFQKNISQL